MLGNTGLKVSVLGLGTMSLDSEEQTIELISAVRKYGVNFFDMAELYGQPMGNASKLFGSALKKLQKKDPVLYRRQDLVITTKLFFGPGDMVNNGKENSWKSPYGPNEKGLNFKKMNESIDEELARLQLNYVDIVYAHRYDANTPMLEIIRGFNKIINDGKAFYWGTSMWTAQKLTEAYWVAKMNNLIPPVVEQPWYNMFARDKLEKEYLPMFEKPYGLGTTVWSPLDSGILTGKYVKDIPKDSRLGGNNRLGNNWYGNENYIKAHKNEKVKKLMEIAKEIDVSMVSLALAWVIKNINVSVCILGGSKAYQLEQNMDAIETAKKLDADILKKIEDILDNSPNKGSSAWQGTSQKYITNPIKR